MTANRKAVTDSELPVLTRDLPDADVCREFARELALSAMTRPSTYNSACSKAAVRRAGKLAPAMKANTINNNFVMLFNNLIQC
jgi:hypothetical protein